MSEPFIGEIRMFGGNFAPRGWALCNGQLLAISQNSALFSLLGTVYGGDGITTFALPNLQGRVPVHMGQGPGLSDRRLGATGGQVGVTLTLQQLPAHRHRLVGSAVPAVTTSPANRTWAVAEDDLYTSGGAPDGLASGAVGSVGNAQAHSNLMPFTTVNFIIALVGIYPSRS